MKPKAFILIFLWLSLCNSLSISEESEKNIGKYQDNIIMRGWLKYFVYSPNSDLNEKPKTFFVNKKYFQQFEKAIPLNIIKPTVQKKDEFGSIGIPSQFHFFFVLTKKTLYVISARQVLFKILISKEKNRMKWQKLFKALKQNGSYHLKKKVILKEFFYFPNIFHKNYFGKMVN